MEPDDARLLEGVSATELRDNLRRMVDTAHYFGRRYLILRGGVPAAVLVGLEDYQKLIAAAGQAMAGNEG